MVTLLHGPTGIGKTRYVFSKYPELYRKPPEHTWFDAYDYQQVTLLDDFAGSASKMSLVFLLQLLDRYPVKVPTKGGHVSFVSEFIYITTNIHPRDWYDYDRREEQYKALARRIHAVVRPSVEDEEVVLTTMDHQDFFDNPYKYE